MLTAHEKRGETSISTVKERAFRADYEGQNWYKHREVQNGQEACRTAADERHRKEQGRQETLHLLSLVPLSLTDVCAVCCYAGLFASEAGKGTHREGKESLRGSQDRHDRRITREETFLPVNACRFIQCTVLYSVSLLFSPFWTVSLMNRARRRRRREKDRKSAYMCVCSQRLAICSCHLAHSLCVTVLPSCCSPL